MKPICKISAVVAASILCASPAFAEDSLEDLAAQAEAAVAAGKTLEALDLATRFSQGVWKTAPLAFRKAELVDSEPTEFGQDTPRASNVYGVDEEIHIYVEPVAFGWRQAGGTWEADMVADVLLATSEGKIIVGHKAFSEFKLSADKPNADAFLALTYVFGGLGAGDYVVTTTLHDRVLGKSGAFTTPITIR